MRTKCLACEARVDTCPRGVALGVISGNIFQSLVGRDSGQPLCMKTKGGLLSAAEVDT